MGEIPIPKLIKYEIEKKLIGSFGLKLFDFLFLRLDFDVTVAAIDYYRSLFGFDSVSFPF